MTVDAMTRMPDSTGRLVMFLVSFLASDESRCVTGEVFTVSGGVAACG